MMKWTLTLLLSRDWTNSQPACMAAKQDASEQSRERKNEVSCMLTVLAALVVLIVLIVLIVLTCPGSFVNKYKER
eukprot:3937743-Rhodomonas_salina.1